MNRIDYLFQEKKGKILSIYTTAGYPGLQDTGRIIKALEKNGADLIELGMPFSDPLADGPVIQQSSQKALENGMTLELFLKQVASVRKETDIPLVFMGYLNPVLQYGIQNFIDSCKGSGIDGLILPDLPLDIYKTDFKPLLDISGIKYIMLITPQTSPERVKEIVSNTGGFLYMVAASSTTGEKKQITDTQIDYFKRVNDMDIAFPRLIGFGISNAETFAKACEYAQGAIIGSAFIKCLGDKAELSIEERIEKFLRSIISV